MKRFRTPASRHLRILAGCLSVLLIVIGMQGCKKQAPKPQTSGQPERAGQAGQPTDSAVVVTVNGSPITEGELDKRTMKVLSEQMGGDPGRFKPEVVEQARKMMRVQVIDVMVSEKLLDQQIEAAGLKTTQQDVVDAINAQGAQMNPPITFDEYKKAALERGQDFNDIMEELRVNLSRQRFVESKLTGTGDVNEAEAKAYYDANPKQFERSEQVRVSHILVVPGASEPNSDPNKARIAAREKAQSLLEKIKAGADFAELAKTDSNDPGSAVNGGDLGFFARGDMVKPFEDVAFALEPNKVSDVVETQFGYHILKQTGHRPAGPIPFEDVKKEIMARLNEQARGKALYEYINSLRAKAKIVYTSPNDAPAPQPVLNETLTPAAATAKPEADANQPAGPADANQK